MDERETSYTFSWNAIWFSHYGKLYVGCLKKLKIELPYDPTIPFLGVYPEKTKTLIRKDPCTPVFTAALFTIAKTWKHTEYPSTDDWFKKKWYIHTVEYYSATKNEILPLAAA